MGVRGELFSAKVALRNRTYFFNVKENRLGDLFMTVVESKPSEGEGFDRHQIVLFADDLQDFLKGFDQSLRYMEKEVGTRGKAKREARSRSDPRNPEADRIPARPPAKKVLRLKDEQRRPGRPDAKDRPRAQERPDAKGRSGYAQKAAGKKKPGAKRPTVRSVKKEQE